MRRSRNEVLGSPYSSQRSHIIDMTGNTVGKTLMFFFLISLLFQNNSHIILVLRSPCSTPGKRIPTEVRIDSPSKRRKVNHKCHNIFIYIYYINKRLLRDKLKYE